MTSPEAKPLPDVSTGELRFLLTLWDTQSLTVAADRHGLSMGAASRRLASLREAFGDELFVRSGHVMTPTARLRDLYPELRSVLTTFGKLFAREAFDLHQARRTVRILSMDNGVLAILSNGIGQFFKDVPDSSIRIEPIDGDLFEKLRKGEADLAVYPMQDVPKDFHVHELYRTRRGILVREGHPLIRRYEAQGRLTLEDLAEFRKVEITFGGAPSWNPSEPASKSGDPTYQTAGIEMPYFLAVPYVVNQTDLTYMSAALTLQHFVRMSEFNLRMLPAPTELADFAPCLIWHRSTHEDPFLEWVRAVITDGSRKTAREAGVLLEGKA